MPTPYTLRPRQRRFYTEKASLYKPNTPRKTVTTYVLMYSNIPCQFVPTDNFDEKQGATKLKQNNIQTSDSIHFHSSQEIGEGWLVLIEPGSIRVPGQWLVMIGDPEVHPVRAKYKRLYCNQQVEPTADMIL